MSISIGPGAHHGFAHGHAQTHGLGRQESPAWQARTADPQAKGSAFGALVSQIAQGKSAGTASAPDTSGVGTTDATPPTTGASDAGATIPSSATAPASDPTTTATASTDPASDPAAPGSTVDIQA